jgi:hypothetical protein
MRKEYQQLIDLGTFKPINYDSLNRSQRRRILRSFAFFKKKTRADGSFEKFKVRHVVNGKQQIKDLLGNVTSATVRTESVFLELLRAVQQQRKVVTADITGAFLKADLPPESAGQIVAFDKDATAVILELKPEWREYVRESDGTLLVELTKAMYGLCEAPKAWYTELTSTLNSLGFQANRYDPCVFNYVRNDEQITVCFHVDDLLVTSRDKRNIDWLINALTARYTDLTIHDESILHYVGLTIDLTNPERAVLSQFGLLEHLLEWYEVDKRRPAATPAGPDLFSDTSDLPLLSEKGKSTFHTIVASLLYIAKRTRPDILLVVNYLSTRVLSPTEGDRRKLARLLSYLAGTVNMPLILEPTSDQSLRLSVDASYGVHKDFKSHSGAIVKLCGGTILAKSNRQHNLAKSSTEAEIYGLSDNLSEAIWCKLYLEEQGDSIGAVLVEQDNQSAIHMYSRGYSTSDRTRHINIRHFWVKDLMDNDIVSIVYTPTADVVSDMLTKPLQGDHFRRLRALLLGHAHI